jgi:hypothetical protein
MENTFLQNFTQRAKLKYKAAPTELVGRLIILSVFAWKLIFTIGPS